MVSLTGYGGGPEISCQPALSFEPSLLGVAQTQQLFCTNAGTNIPGHPEITLRFSQGDLSTDNSVFTASLGLPDGGPLAADAGVSLQLGRQRCHQRDIRSDRRRAGLREVDGREQ